MRNIAHLNTGRLFPWVVLLVAFMIRLLPVWWGRDLTIGLDDMFQYDMIARSIASGHGFRWYALPDLNLIQPYLPADLAATPGYDPNGVITGFRAPLYPLLLAIIYKIVGAGAERFLAARLVQALMGASLAPLTFMASLYFFPQKEKAARFAAWVLALYPILLIFPLALATENLFFILFLGSAIALLWAAQRPSSWRFLLPGILLGLTALTRSIVLVSSTLVILWIWFYLRNRRGAIITAGSMLLVIAPWMVRNQFIFHRPVIELSMGYNLYMGYHPLSTGDFQYGISLDLMNTLDDGLRDTQGTSLAMGFIRSDPGRVPYLALRRLGYFWGLERRGLTFFYSNDFFGHLPFGVLLSAALILLLPFVIVSTSAAVGFALITWDRNAVLLALLVGGYILPNILILSEDRFHLALIPFLAIIASQFWSGGWSAVAGRWHGSAFSKVMLSLACLAVFFLFLNWGMELYRDADKLVLLFGPHGNTTHFTY